MSKKDLFRLDAKKTTNFTEQKSFEVEGMYKPNTKKAKDPREGYSALIRFLPNFTQNQEVEDNAIHQTFFYVNIDEYPELNGKIFSKTMYNEKCPLGLAHKKIKDANKDDERLKMLGKQTKYYSYVLVIEDENKPEYEGKVMIWEFGHKIKEKIDNEMKGKNRKKEICNVYDLAEGKDFQILITGSGDRTNYDNCLFVENPSPITLKKGAVPVEEDEDGRKVIHPDFQDKLVQFLLKRKKNLEELAPEPWDDDTIDKVNQIVDWCNGRTPAATAKQSIANASQGKKPSKPAAVETESDDDDEEYTPPAKQAAKPAAKTSTTTKGKTMTATDFFGGDDDDDDDSDKE